MSQSAHVSSDALHILMDGLQDCASSVASLRSAVRTHIMKCYNNAKSLVERLRRAEEQAKTRFEICQQTYYACQRRQKYDEESREYRPSCSCEERDMKDAESIYYRARKIRECAESHLSSMEYEIANYQCPTGGEGKMNSISDDYVPRGTERLMALNEKVHRYETMEITGIDTGDSSSSTPILKPNHSIFRNGIKDKFSHGIRKVRESAEAKCCPKCHQILCICEQKERERVLQREQRQRVLQHVLNSRSR